MIEMFACRLAPLNLHVVRSYLGQDQYVSVEELVMAMADDERFGAQLFREQVSGGCVRDLLWCAPAACRDGFVWQCALGHLQTVADGRRLRGLFPMLCLAARLPQPCCLSCRA